MAADKKISVIYQYHYDSGTQDALTLPCSRHRNLQGTKMITKLKTIAASLALLGGSLLIAGTANAGAIISNGTVQLGVRDLGNLNEPGGTSAAGSGTSIVGLRSVATNSDSTSPGCTCEGWGVGITSTGQAGFANDSVGTANLSLVSFVSTASTAVSITNVTNAAGAAILQVTHNYHPIAGTPFLYAVDVAIKNMTGTALASGDLVYRRVMDWDIPSPGRELVSIQGVPALLGLANGSNLRRTDNNGFNSGNPFTFTPFGLTDINFVDASGDIGALFDFEFEALADGATRTFTTYYGVAPDKATADLARSLVDGDASDVEIGLYSYGRCGDGDSFSNGTTTFACTADGAPNTFIFGFGAAAGVLDPVDPGTSVPEPGSLALLGLSLAGLAAMRRRQKNS